MWYQLGKTYTKPPGDALRMATRVPSTICFLIEIFLIGLAWWYIMSVEKEALPRTEIHNLSKTFENNFNDTSISEELKHYNDWDIVSAQHNILEILQRLHITLLPLCRNSKIKLQENYIAPLFYESLSLKPDVEKNIMSFQDIIEHAHNKHLHKTIQKMNHVCESYKKENESSYNEFEALLDLGHTYEKEVKELLNATALFNIPPILLVRDFLTMEPVTSDFLPTTILSSTSIGFLQITSSNDISHLVHQIMMAWSPSLQTTLKAKLLFRFFLATDRSENLDWKFESTIYTPWVQPILHNLNDLISIETISMVVFYSDLSEHLLYGAQSNTTTSQENSILKQSLTAIPSIANTWSWSPVVSQATNFPPSVLHLGLWIPSVSNVYFKDNSQQCKNSLHRSARLPGWGVIAVADDLNIDTKKSVVRMWIAHLRTELGLPPNNFLKYLDNEMFQLEEQKVFFDSNNHPKALQATILSKEVNEKISTQSTPKRKTQMIIEIPSRYGFTDWELTFLKRYALKYYLKEGIASLKSLLHVLDSQRGLPIRSRLVNNTRTAVIALENSFKSCLAADTNHTNALSAAVQFARTGFVAAKESLFDYSATGETYLSLEYVIALYMPLVVPIFASILKLLSKEYKIWKACKGHLKTE